MAIWRAAGEAAEEAAGEDWSADSGPLEVRACRAEWAENAASGRPLESARMDQIGPQLQLIRAVGRLVAAGQRRQKSVSLDAAVAVEEQMSERE